MTQLALLDHTENITLGILQSFVGLIEDLKSQMISSDSNSNNHLSSGNVELFDDHLDIKMDG